MTPPPAPAPIDGNTMHRQAVRLACADVLQTVYLFDKENAGRVTIEQIERVSSYDRDTVREALRYLIDAEYIEDRTARVDHGDKRRMLAFGITKAGRDLYLRNTEDLGVDFGD